MSELSVKDAPPGRDPSEAGPRLGLAELLSLKGKNAIVTGGAMGIGLGIARRLAEAGACVMIADRNEEAAKKSAAELSAKGFKAFSVTVDVSNEKDVERMVQETVRVCGGIDILVNDAGIFPSAPLVNMPAEEFDKVIAVNLKGVFLCIKYVSAQMIARGNGGRIINITSIDALHPSMVGLAHYDASKHGAWGFTKNVALELSAHRIWVNAVAPGGVSTPGVAAMQQGAPMPAGVDMKKVLDAFLARIPMKRMGDPDDIGKVVLFLASDMSSYMTGSQIVVDGGALLM